MVRLFILTVVVKLYSYTETVMSEIYEKSNIFTIILDLHAMR